MGRMRERVPRAKNVVVRPRPMFLQVGWDSRCEMEGIFALTLKEM